MIQNSTVNNLQIYQVYETTKNNAAQLMSFLHAEYVI